MTQVGLSAYIGLLVVAVLFAVAWSVRAKTADEAEPGTATMYSIFVFIAVLLGLLVPGLWVLFGGP